MKRFLLLILLSLLFPSLSYGEDFYVSCATTKTHFLSLPAKGKKIFKSGVFTDYLISYNGYQYSLSYNFVDDGKLKSYELSFYSRLSLENMPHYLYEYLQWQKDNTKKFGEPVREILLVRGKKIPLPWEPVFHKEVYDWETDVNRENNLLFFSEWKGRDGMIVLQSFRSRKGEPEFHIEYICPGYKSKHIEYYKGWFNVDITEDSHMR